MVEKKWKAGNVFSKILEAKNQQDFRNLAVQRLGLSAFTADGLGSIPVWRMTIPQAAWSGKTTTTTTTTKQKNQQDLTQSKRAIECFKLN